MKIDGITNIIEIKKIDKVNPYQRNSSGPAGGKDNLAVSEVGRLSQQIETAMKNTPEIRFEKVKPIQDSLAAGTYKVDPLAIARKMLED